VGDFLHQMYGDAPALWSDALTGIARLRVIVNALTRLRFCNAVGAMEFTTKEGSEAAPPGYMPWFDVPGRRTTDVTVAFGHWSTLGWLGREDLISLDTGCVWGGCLSALRLLPMDKPDRPNTDRSLHQQLIQVKCEQAQKPT
jgi:bis(5'-nucleosyl)-tetraphosphatase (symmetrical)